MFSVTPLGNHGFAISSAAGSSSNLLLVDPLLHARYGWTDAVGLHVFPPRRVEPAAFPEVDGVLLTHEHEGHFDIASLDLLSRDIPIYLSSLSSLAMREILGEMGFTTRLVRPGRPFSVGDIEIVPMAADQEGAAGEEWDNLPYLARDLRGDGSFFTAVDVVPNEAMWKAAMSKVARPGLWMHTNNYSQWDFLYSWASPDPRSLQRFVSSVFEYHRKMSEEWAPPEALLLLGGGFSFGGGRDWLNREVFPCSSEEAARVLAAVLPGERVYAPAPGETFVMQGGALAGVEPAPAYLGALPRPEWPSRGHAGEIPWLEELSPATGRASLMPGELSALEAELARFAAFLYARAPLRRLYSLSAEELGGRRPTFALLLRADEDGGAYVYEYEPQGCRFRAASSEDPVSEYLAVYECFATDLLALLRCEISSASLTLGRCRHFAAEVELFDLDVYLMLYAHPLRQPARFLSLYREVYARRPKARPQIRARRSE
jgi:hypothetical protein